MASERSDQQSERMQEAYARAQYPWMSIDVPAVIPPPCSACKGSGTLKKVISLEVRDGPRIIALTDHVVVTCPICFGKS